MKFGSFQTGVDIQGEVAPWQPQPRPEWVSALNYLAADMAVGGVAAIDLRAEALLAQAMEKTGLSNFGDDAFKQGLTVLTQSLIEEAELNFVGTVIARDEILSALETRLRVFDMIDRHPEILQQEIQAPVFIGGSGRTGSSLTHELLQQDPNHRAVWWWEMREPAMAPDQSLAEREQRIDDYDKAIGFCNLVTPEIMTCHAVGARIVTECVTIFWQEFLSPYFSFFYHVPSYSHWLATADMRPAYDYHKKFLQVLQWQQPRKRWVLKTAGHITDMDTVLAVYPDAKFVNTHRDPLRVLASLGGYHGAAIWMHSEKIPNVRAMLEGASLGMLAQYNRTIEMKQAGTPAEDAIYDLRYADLVKNPIAEMRALYQQLGWHYTPEAEEAMRAYLAKNKKGKHGRYDYSFADTGLDLALLRERFTDYQKHYGIPSEV